MNKEFSSLDGTIKKHQKETLTPYKVAVVMFIKIYCSDANPKVIVEKRDFCIAILKLIQSPDLEKRCLLDLINSTDFALQRFSTQLEEDLTTLCVEGVKELLDLFDSLGNLMKPVMDMHQAPLNKHSVLGLYIRRSVMLFQKLTFHSVVSLYEDLKNYCVNDFSEETTNSIDESMRRERNSSRKSKIWGGRQAELLVAQQAHALLTDEHKALPPAELQQLVRDLLSSSPYYAEAHYLSYLNYLRIREYCLAIDSLYHCFDGLAPLESRPSTEDKLRTFRYAALNLAALYAQFRYKESAQQALKEAIMLAQEAGDNVCLQLAHSWVWYLKDKNKGPLIERSIAKATELGMTHTASLALIASAHESAMEGANPQTVFETLMISDVLNNQHSMIDLMSMMYAEKTALWAYYGKTEMASVCAQLLLLFNSGEKKQLMFNGTSTCQAIVTVANILFEMGEFSFADIVLAHAKERFPNQPSSMIWALAERLHKFTKLIRSEKWSAAEEIAEQISVLDPIESKFRLAEVLFARHNFPEAIKIAYELAELEDITAQQKVRAKLLVSQIKAGSCYAGTAQSVAGSILHLSKALDIATTNHLSYYAALVNMYIVNTQLLLKMPFQALKNIREPIIHILAHGGLYDQARAYILYAKVLSANAAEQKEKKKKKMMMLDAVRHLFKAKKLFEKLEATDRLKSTLYLLSVFYHETDMCEERNKCAFEWKQMDQQFPTEKNHIFLF